MLNITGRAIGQGGGAGDGSIQSLIQQILAPQLAFYNQQRSDLTARQAAQQEALKGFTTSLLGYLQGIPRQIDQTYGKAVADTSSLGNAAAQGLINANPNGAAVATLNAIGAPQAQVNAITQQNADVFGGGAGVLNYVGGALPAETLSADRAANVAFAQSLPGIQSMTAAQAFRQLLGSQSAQQSDIDQALAKIRSDAQSQAYGIQNDIAQQALAAQKYAAQRADAAFNRKYKVASLNQSGRLANARLNQQGAIASDRSQQGWARVAQSRASLDQRSQQFAARYGLDQQKLALQQAKFSYSVANPKTAAKKGGFTALQIRKMKSDAADTALDGFNGSYVDNKGKKVDIGHKTYQSLVADMTAHGIPLSVAQTAANRYWRQGAPGAVVVRVNAPEKGYVYYPSRGEKPQDGRPLVPYQLRPRPKGGASGRAQAAAATPIQVIRQYAAKLGLDPAAVLAYALTQGGTSWGAVGDHGTSFGPFQAHQGGALGSHDAAWANSPQGLIELMGMMARAGARGRQGPDAAAYIVGPAFGRGANPARDQANARAQYARAIALLGGG